MNEKKIVYWDTFVEKVKDFYRIQIQGPGVTIDFAAKDLSFVEEILDFIEETRENPKYKNTKSEDGTWTSDFQEIKLNKYMKDCKLTIGHFSEYNSCYSVRLKQKPLRICLEFYDQDVDRFIESLKDIKRNS